MHMGIYKTGNKIESFYIADFFALLIIISNTGYRPIAYRHICLIDLSRKYIDHHSSAQEEIRPTQPPCHFNLTP
jgi:hypothetical protein